MPPSYVLDSFAILALLGDEPGSQDVVRILNQAERDEARLFMSWINAAEVAYIVERRWGRQHLFQVLGTLEATPITFVPADRTLSLRAASIKASHPIAFADAFAAALALQEDAGLVTGDPEFDSLTDIVNIIWLER